MNSYLKDTKIDHKSIVPVYLQLATLLSSGIEDGKLVKGEILPSLHELHVQMEISRNSVERAYTWLKKQGLVASFKGKGHFVTQDKNHHIMHLLKMV